MRISLAGAAVGLALVAAGIAQLQAPAAPPRAEELAPRVTAPQEPMVSETPSPASLTVASSSPPAVLGEGWRIRVARLGIDMPLRDGDVARDVELQRTPEGAAFRLPGSAVPGAAGNTYVYGHARAGMFIALWSARLGDIVEISGPSQILRYRVAEIHPRVATTDLTYLLPSTDERVTLQTSTGPLQTDPRFVVIALPEDR